MITTKKKKSSALRYNNHINADKILWINILRIEKCVQFPLITCKHMFSCLISLFVPCREEITNHFAPLVNSVKTYKKLSAIHFSFSYILETMYDSLTWLNQLFLYISFQVFLVTGCRHPLLRNLYYRPQLRTQFKRLQTGPSTRLIAFYSVYRENDHTCV